MNNIAKIAVSLLLLFTNVTAFASEMEPDSVVERGPSAVGEKRALTFEDQLLLRRGEIEDSRYITGGVVGTIVGFGIGHAIQGHGRYRERGWIFTMSEGISCGFVVLGLISVMGDTIDGKRPDNSQAGLFLAMGGLGYIGFHIWEIVDLWAVPPRINERYRQLRGENDARIGSQWHWFPTLVGENGTPGLAVVGTF